MKRHTSKTIDTAKGWDHDLTPTQEMLRSQAAEIERLRKENKQLADFVIEVGGFWGKTKSVLVGEDSLAKTINKVFEENAEMECQIDRLRAANTKMLFDAAKHQILGIKAQAVVDRWDTPLWKDVPATAVYINELRKVLEQK